MINTIQILTSSPLIFKSYTYSAAVIWDDIVVPILLPDVRSLFVCSYVRAPVKCSIPCSTLLWGPHLWQKQLTKVGQNRFWACFEKSYSWALSHAFMSNQPYHQPVRDHQTARHNHSLNSPSVFCNAPQIHQGPLGLTSPRLRWKSFVWIFWKRN